MRIIRETKRVNRIKRAIKELDAKELEFLQEIIRSERHKRKEEVYHQWLHYLDELFNKNCH